MADIAVVFHWPPSAFETMPVNELLDWHKRAAARSGSEE